MPAKTRSLAILPAVLLLTSLLAACGSSSGNNPGTSPQTSKNTIAITAGAFVPFITVVKAGDTVTWKNTDSVAHPVMSTPKHTNPQGDNSGIAYDPSAFLNLDNISQTVAPGATATQTFSKPGLYDFYDNTKATWDAATSRVKANANAPGFPLAMEGVIWVQGNISGLPMTAKNGVLTGKDDFLFNFVAIQKGGTVNWHNYDTDKHYVSLIPGWKAPINPMDIGLNTLKGTADAPPNGGDTPVTFSTPGLYYYFCTSHADPDATTNRVKAHTDASLYPIPMEGFVLVNG